MYPYGNSSKTCPWRDIMGGNALVATPHISQDRAFADIRDGLEAGSASHSLFYN